MTSRATVLASVGPRKYDVARLMTQRHRPAASPIRILSLDGGGIRGIMPLSILMRLERDTGKRVQDMFDLIIGTSTGGIIAMALTELNRSPEWIFQFYMERVTGVFNRNIFSRTWGLSMSNSRYSTDVMNQLIQDTAEGRKVQSFSSGPRSIAVACAVGQHVECKQTDVARKLHMAHEPHGFRPSAYLFRNFQTNSTLKGSNDFQVWEAMRATSAAPTYWLPCLMLSHHGGRVLVDGGVGNNNPTMLGFLEARALWQVTTAQAVPNAQQLKQLRKSIAAVRSETRSEVAAAIESAAAEDGSQSEMAASAPAPGSSMSLDGSASSQSVLEADLVPAQQPEQDIRPPAGAGQVSLQTKIGIVLSLGTGIRDEEENVKGNVFSSLGWMSDSLTTGEMVHDQCMSLFVGADMPAYFRFQPRDNTGALGLDETNRTVLMEAIHKTDAYMASSMVAARYQYLVRALSNDAGSTEVENAAAFAAAEAASLLHTLGCDRAQDRNSAKRIANNWDRS